MSSGRTVIAGTEHSLRPGERIIGAAPPDQSITVTILLRRPSSGSTPSAEDLLSGRAQPVDRKAAEESLRADPADMTAAAKFLESEGLRVLEQDPAGRRIRATGTATQMDAAFGVQLKNATTGNGPQYLTYDGAITVPASLTGVVTAVLGLDNRAVATHH